MADFQLCTALFFYKIHLYNFRNKTISYEICYFVLFRY